MDRKQTSGKMLTNEEVQEVRYCLKTLREQMAARQASNNNDMFLSTNMKIGGPERKPNGTNGLGTCAYCNQQIPSNGFKVDVAVSKPNGTNGLVSGSHFNHQVQEDDEKTRTLREISRNLFIRMKEMEKKHQAEKEKLQAENSEYQRRFLEVQKTEKNVEEQGTKLEDMQKLVDGLKLENDTLQQKLRENETLTEKDSEDRSEQLERELATLKDKNHNLDDMLKSQHKKIRNMIEQVQISRTTVDQSDRMIADLKERVAFLEAENREMHDRMEFYQGKEVPNPYKSDMGSRVVYSKTLTPTSPGNKILPFIKVVEMKS